MRMLIAATCSAGVAVALASPAIAAAPPPTVPSDAAIAQYVEAVPSATGPVATGGAASRAGAAALSTALRAKVERTAGADAPALLHLAQDPRFGSRPTSRADGARATPRHRANPRHRASHAPAVPRPPVLRSPVAESAGAPTPSALSAAASTAGSGGLLLVALLLVAITTAAIA